MKELDKKFIGKKYSPIQFNVEKQRLKFFSKATGQSDPIYFDEAIAKEKGFPSIVAPPTFLTTIGYEKENPYDYLEDLGISIARILSAGQKYYYFNLIFGGDIIFMESEIQDIYVKKAGKLQFIEFLSIYTNQSDLSIARSVSTLVFR
tara:strand:+ start:1042 stop:1485 length:444 start_codon:yes stop_codon:yes gene_type:complete